MAIDLPPAIPPQLSTVERIEAYAPSSASSLSVTVGEQRLVITGNRYLSEKDIQQIAAAATSPSQAIRALSEAYYQQGHLLVTVYYAAGETDIRVHVINASVADIVAPQSIRAHFKGLIGDRDLTIADFETRRVLADLKSERSADNYRVSYSLRDGDPEAYILRFSQQPISEADIFDVLLQLGNQSNRYLGRYVAGAGLKQRLDSGGEVFLGYETVLVEWGEARNGEDYQAYQLAFNYPSRWGLYGVEAEHVAYELTATAVSQEGESTPEIVDLGNALLCSSDSALCDNGDSLGGLGGLLDPLGDLGDAGGDGGLGGEAPLPGDAPVAIRTVMLEADIDRLAVTGEQLLYSDRRQRLAISERLEYIDSRIEVQNGNTLLDEAYASMEVGAQYYRGIQLGDMPLTMSAELFAEMGLSSNDGSLGTDQRDNVVSQGKRSAEYTLYRPGISVSLRPMDKLAFDLDMAAQFADEQLPQQQQWVLGGINQMAAYLPGVLVGDTGSYSQLSASAGGWRLWGTNLNAVLFVEYGQASYENVSGELDFTRSITDGGVRFQASWDNGWGMEWVAAVPMGDDNIPQRDLDRFEVDFYWQITADL